MASGGILHISPALQNRPAPVKNILSGTLTLQGNGTGAGTGSKWKDYRNVHIGARQGQEPGPKCFLMSHSSSLYQSQSRSSAVRICFDQWTVPLFN